MKLSSIIVIILTLLAIVATIISMASFWEYVKIETTDPNEGDSVITVYFKYNQMKGSVDSNGFKTSYTTSIPSEFKDTMKDTLQIHSAAFAFNVLAFISLVASFAVITCTIIPGVSSKLPSVVSMVGKIMIIAGLVFCLISMFVFLGVPNARYNDCKRNNPDTDPDIACPKEGYFKDFSGSLDNGSAFGSIGKMSFGPYTSWITIVIASGITLAAVIMSFVGGVFNFETAGN